MKREFVLKIFESATDEQISAILNENGKDLEASRKALEEARGKLSTAETEAKGLKEQLEQRDKDIEELRGKVSEKDTISKELSDLQEKYKKDTDDLQAQIDSGKRSRASEKLFDGYEFSSDYAKKAIMAEFDEQKFKLDDKTGEYVGGKEWLDNLKTSSPTAFKVPAADPDPNTNPSNEGGTDPKFSSGTNGGKTPPKIGLTELMRRKNENPNMQVNFDMLG